MHVLWLLLVLPTISTICFPLSGERKHDDSQSEGNLINPHGSGAEKITPDSTTTFRLTTNVDTSPIPQGLDSKVQAMLENLLKTLDLNGLGVKQFTFHSSDTQGILSGPSGSIPSASEAPEPAVGPTVWLPLMEWRGVEYTNVALLDESNFDAVLRRWNNSLVLVYYPWDAVTGDVLSAFTHVDPRPLQEQCEGCGPTQALDFATLSDVASSEVASDDCDRFTDRDSEPAECSLQEEDDDHHLFCTSGGSSPDGGLFVVLDPICFPHFPKSSFDRSFGLFAVDLSANPAIRSRLSLDQLGASFGPLVFHFKHSEPTVEYGGRHRTSPMSHFAARMLHGPVLPIRSCKTLAWMLSLSPMAFVGYMHANQADSTAFMEFQAMAQSISPHLPVGIIFYNNDSHVHQLDPFLPENGDDIGTAAGTVQVNGVCQDPIPVSSEPWMRVFFRRNYVPFSTDIGSDKTCGMTYGEDFVTELFRGEWSAGAMMTWAVDQSFERYVSELSSATHATQLRRVVQRRGAMLILFASLEVLEDRDHPTMSAFEQAARDAGRATIRSPAAVSFHTADSAKLAEFAAVLARDGRIVGEPMFHHEPRATSTFLLGFVPDIARTIRLAEPSDAAPYTRDRLVELIEIAESHDSDCDQPEMFTPVPPASTSGTAVSEAQDVTPSPTPSPLLSASDGALECLSFRSAVRPQHISTLSNIPTPWRSVRHLSPWNFNRLVLQDCSLPALPGSPRRLQCCLASQRSASAPVFQREALVLFHQPMCGFCRRVLAVTIPILSKLLRQRGVLVGEYDCSVYSIPPLVDPAIRGFPEFLFFPGHNANASEADAAGRHYAVFDGAEFNVPQLLAFVRKHSTHAFGHAARGGLRSP